MPAVAFDMPPTIWPHFLKLFQTVPRTDEEDFKYVSPWSSVTFKTTQGLERQCFVLYRDYLSGRMELTDNYTLFLIVFDLNSSFKVLHFNPRMHEAEEGDLPIQS